MRMRLGSYHVLAGTLLFATACQTYDSPAASGLAVEAASHAVPVAAGTDSTWAYLSARYDADGDGTIRPEEYVREGGRFERIDRNGDGVVDATDFERAQESGGRTRGGGAEDRMSGMRARRILMTYFQLLDGDAAELTLEELEAAFDLYDANHDLSLTATEFEGRSAGQKADVPGSDSRMVQMVMRDVDPWEALLAGIDDDEDGALHYDEVEAFFGSVTRGSGVIALSADADRGAARGGRGEDAPKKTGATAGEPAPDFTLSSPHGGKPVTLSSFRGKRPVALIFGSYT